jgi:hypothetical protein
MELLLDRYPFYIIMGLAAIIYELGFATKLPLLKKIIVYLLLVAGCIPLTILKVMGLPMIQAMAVAAVLMIGARIRRKGTDDREDK